VDQRMSIEELEQKARFIRQRIIDLTVTAGSGHVGGALSMTDVAVVLYYRILRIDPSRPDWPERDRFVLSKGHGGLGLYPILADLGYFPAEELKTYNKLDSRFGMHPDMRKIPGIEMSTGSLGHGLAVAIGMALTARLRQERHRICVLMGDGECQEGTVWEAAMAAAHHRLGNIVGIVDRNMYQVDGGTEELAALEPLVDKWRAFGWQAMEVDGHDIPELVRVFEGLDVGLHRSQPTVVIANTIKGRGVGFMERGGAAWHLGSLSDDQVEEARRDIARMEATR
jgi:transketolase